MKRHQRSSPTAGNSMRPAAPEWFREVLRSYLLPPRDSEKKKREEDEAKLWILVEKVGLARGRFSRLVSQIWDDGYGRVVAHANAKHRVSVTEATQRAAARGLSADARFLADRIERVLRAGTISEQRERDQNFGLWMMLWPAFFEPQYASPLDAEARAQYDPTGSYARFPDLAFQLRDFSAAIERCLKSRRTDVDSELETQAANLNTLREVAFFGRGNGEAGETIVKLLTGSNGHVHWSVWRRLLLLMYPVLKLKLTNKDLKDYATRLLSNKGG